MDVETDCGEEDERRSNRLTVKVVEVGEVAEVVKVKMVERRIV